MALDRLDTDDEEVGYLLRGMAFGDEFQDLLLTVGNGPLRRRPAVPGALQITADDDADGAGVIIVVEDIFLALYLAALQPIISGAQGPSETVLQAAKAFGFLLVLAAAARYGTRLFGFLIAVREDELLVISFLGTVVLIAGLSEVLGVADAIGAFMTGLILAGTSSAPRIPRPPPPRRLRSDLLLRHRPRHRPRRHRIRRRPRGHRSSVDHRGECNRGTARRPPVPLRHRTCRRHRHHASRTRRVRTHPGRPCRKCRPR
ncbi:hypothetical protein Sm713_67980 [Streptomyces sp. TS71-3]|nr:hypothetical protein Sm713_67980 [Streptomyces sp. TS71-3]